MKTKSNAVPREKNAASLYHRELEIERAATTISINLMQNVKIIDCLKLICQVLYGKAAAVYSFDLTATTFKFINCYQGKTARKQFSTHTIQSDEFPWSIQEFSARNKMTCGRTSKSVDQFAHLKKLLSIPASDPVTIIPLYFIKRMNGFIVLINRTKCPQWTRIEDHFIKVISNVFGRYFECQRKQAELEQSKIQYEKLLQSFFDGVIITIDEKIAYINQAGSRLLGRGHEDEIIGKSVYDFSDPEQAAKFKSLIQTAKSGERSPFFELTMHRLNGEKLKVEGTINSILYQGKSAQQIILRDITKRNKTYRQIIESEKNFRNLLDSLSLGVALVVDGKNAWVNHAFSEMLGYSKDELIGIGPEFYVTPEYFPIVMQRLKDRLDGLPIPSQYEILCVRKDGTKFYMQLHPRMIQFRQQKADLVIAQDVTEQKMAEQQLRVSEHRYRTLAEAAPDLIFSINRDFVFEYVNEKAGKLSDLRIDQIIGQSLEKVFVGFNKNQIKKWKTDLQRAFIRQERYYSEDLLHFPLQGDQWLGSWLVPLLNDKGEAYSMLGISRNITDQKMIEQQLRQSEEKYRTLFEKLNDALIIVLDGKFIDVNPSALEMFRCSREELINSTPWDFTPEFQSDGRRSIVLGQHFINQALTGKAISFSWLHKRKDGTLFNAEVTLTRFFMDTKWHLFGIVRDVSESLRAEAALRASEARFRDTIERNVDGYYFMDLQGKIKYVNPAIIEMTGYPVDEMIDHLFQDFVSPDFLDVTAKNIKSALSGTTGSWTEFKFRKKNNEEYWIVASIRRVIENGIVMGVEGFVKDISHIKKVEEELRIKEARYRTLFDNIPYEVYGLDQHLCFLEINQEFIRIWGDITGKSPQELSHAELGRFIFKLAKMAQKNEDTVQQDFAFTREYDTLYYKIIISPILADGSILGFVGLNIDISGLVRAVNDAKYFSAQLFDIQEEERARISREIHDSLGQMLTALQFELGTVISVLDTDVQQAQNVLQDMKKNITQAIIEARDLCHNLRPHVLDDFGLFAALEDYIQEYQEKWKIHIDFEFQGSLHTLTIPVQIALYRVALEALTNILKYAQASKVIIKLIVMQDKVDLFIGDNGKGFELQHIRKDTKKHLGLTIMNERIKFLGGTVLIESQPEHGTIIKVSVPLL